VIAIVSGPEAVSSGLPTIFSACAHARRALLNVDAIRPSHRCMRRDKS
jgi:hypothetical protein